MYRRIRKPYKDRYPDDNCEASEKYVDDLIRRQPLPIIKRNTLHRTRNQLHLLLMGEITYVCDETAENLGETILRNRVRCGNGFCGAKDTIR